MTAQVEKARGVRRRFRQWWLDRRTTEVTLPNGDRLLKVRGKLTTEQVDDLLRRWRRAESGTEWSRTDPTDCPMCAHGCHPADCPYSPGVSS